MVGGPAYVGDKESELAYNSTSGHGSGQSHDLHSSGHGGEKGMEYHQEEAQWQGNHNTVTPQHHPIPGAAGYTSGYGGAEPMRAGQSGGYSNESHNLLHPSFAQPTAHTPVDERPYYDAREPDNVNYRE